MNQSYLLIHNKQECDKGHKHMILLLKHCCTWIGLGPYLNRAPRSWFLRLPGPTPSVDTAIEGAPPPELDLIERPRTMPANQEEDEADEEKDGEVTEGSIAPDLIFPSSMLSPLEVHARRRGWMEDLNAACAGELWTGNYINIFKGLEIA